MSVGGVVVVVDVVAAALSILDYSCSSGNCSQSYFYACYPLTEML